MPLDPRTAALIEELHRGDDDRYWDWGGRTEPLAPDEKRALLAVAEELGRAARRNLDAITLAALLKGAP